MEKKIGFVAIGETIVFGGIRAIAVDADDRVACEGCVFCDNEEKFMGHCPCTEDVTCCYHGDRKDGKNIEFKEYDKG